jgi:hypothetical protein
MNSSPPTAPTPIDKSGAGSAFKLALIANFIWINASEIWRYLMVVKPMLHETFPGRADIAPFDLPTFAIWSIWDTWLIASATGFYWLYLNWAGPSIRQALIAATLFTVTTIGLIWLGVYNMGLAPLRFLLIAAPLAWVEQAVAAVIVWWAMGRRTPS